MTFLEEQAEIERQLNLMCQDKAIDRETLYTHDWTEGEKFVIMRLLELKMKSTRNEFLHGLKKTTKIYLLDEYRQNKLTNK